MEHEVIDSEQLAQIIEKSVSSPLIVPGTNAEAKRGAEPAEASRAAAPEEESSGEAAPDSNGSQG
jgi:hypothetical protein